MAPIKSSKQPVYLRSKSANEFAFKSQLKGPIKALSVLRRSLLFAEISMAAYLTTEQCNLAAGKLGFTDGKFFDCGGIQAYWFQNRSDSVVVFRGTEVHQWNDLAEDANGLTALSETVGRVHCGFKSHADEIWPLIEAELTKNSKPLWFCGHSLGGAIASICAGRCMLSYLKSEPEELYTFGSPRVGSKRYVKHVPLSHYRWVNNNDVVTRFPLARQGYRHAGTAMHIDRLGRLKEVQGLRWISDQMKTAFSGLRQPRTDPLTDHSSPAYVDAIFKIIRTEEGKPASRFAQPGEVVDQQDESGSGLPNDQFVEPKTRQQMSA